TPMEYGIGESEAKRKATAFYGGRERGSNTKTVHCVVRWPGHGDPNASIDWHHLDERKPRWWDYVNIFPLSSDLNGAIERRRWKELALELRPSVLDAKARAHYQNGRFSFGYGCARLGCFLTVPHREDAALGIGIAYDLCVQFASFALLDFIGNKEYVGLYSFTP